MKTHFKALLIAFILAAIPIAVSGQITVPYTFSANTTILSSQVNANFAKFSDTLNRTGGTMTGTLNTQAILPDADNTRDIGSAALSYNDGWFDGTLTTVVQTVTGVLTNTAAAVRGIVISRSAADAGLQIVSSGGSGKAYGLVSDTTGQFFIQDDADADPLIALSSAGAITLKAVDGQGVVLTRGQLNFPAVQVPAAGANVLDDYEEGTWTPAITFDTPGDLAVTYTTQTGIYTKVGRKVTLDFTIVTSSFTHTTAANAFKITGIPFTVHTSMNGIGSLYFTGVTIASYTNFVTRAIAGASQIDVMASGTAQTATQLTAAHFPTGSNKTIVGSITYAVD